MVFDSIDKHTFNYQDEYSSLDTDDTELDEAMEKSTLTRKRKLIIHHGSRKKKTSLPTRQKVS